MDRIPVTVIIPVRNEQANLPRCLERLGAFDQIFVVDSSSTDDTAAIAESFGAVVVNFLWNGRFPKKRNWALRNLPIRNPWVLFLDADEFLTDAFLRELPSAVAREDVAGYWVRYSVYMLGRRLRRGDGMYKLPLFRLGTGEYERIDEDRWSPLDMEVHEHPVIRGKVRGIRAEVEHNDFKGLESYKQKHRDYARWEARRYMALRSGGRAEGRPTPRQRLKYLLLGAGIAAPVYFLGSYILRLGFLDGAAGYRQARLKAWYFSLVRREIRALKKQANE